MQKIRLIIVGNEILSGKRQDKHFAQMRQVFAQRYLQIHQVIYAPDELQTLTDIYRQAVDSGDLVLSFGGIGATPDDVSRQAFALAVQQPLEINALAQAEIEAQFGEAAYPQRIKMAEFARGASILPNPVNRVAGFKWQHCHLMPGFPQMAWPMVDWLLTHHYAQLLGEEQMECEVMVYNRSESELIPLMEQTLRDYAMVQLASLPHIAADGQRSIALSLKGPAQATQIAFKSLCQSLTEQGYLSP